MNKIICVTGATGKIGKAVTQLLINSGIEVRATGRDSKKLNLLNEQGASVFTGNLEDTGFLINIFKDADAVLAITPDNFNETDFKGHKKKLASSIVSAIRESKIPNVVAISSVGADLAEGIGPIGPLHHMEMLLRELRGTNIMIMRCAFYMENLLASIPMIKTMGIIGGAFSPDTFLPMISTSDVSQIAAEYLSTGTFTGYNIKYLLGPHDYTYPEITAAISKAIAKPELKYIQFQYDELRNALTQAGFSLSGANALIESAAAHNTGQIQSTVKREKESTTKTTIEDFAVNIFAREYKAEYSTDFVI